MTLPTAVALEIAQGAFPEGDTYKVALFLAPLTVTSSKNFADAVAAGTEASTADGYPAGGFTLTSEGTFFWRIVGSTAIYSVLSTQSGTGATFTFQSLLIYNFTDAGDIGLYFFNAGADQIVSNGQLTIVWPVADDVTGLVRVPQ